MCPGEQPLSVRYSQKSSKIPSLSSVDNYRNVSKHQTNIILRWIIFSMHSLLPFVGMAARVSLIEQHFSRGAGLRKNLLGNYTCIIFNHKPFL
jgi:hypothetical protein